MSEIKTLDVEVSFPDVLEVDVDFGQTLTKIVAPDHYTGPFDIFPSDEDQIIPVKEKTPVEDICVKGISGEETITQNGTYNTLEDKTVIVNVAPKELYPVGTDVVSVYLGRNWRTGNALLLHGTYTSTGDFTETGNEANYSFCPVYIPISPEYAYYKNDNRIMDGFWYDENKNFISRFSQNNLSRTSLPTPPDNAKYLRFASNTGWSNAGIAIYRTA